MSKCILRAAARPRCLQPFPTRRSSDLNAGNGGECRRQDAPSGRLFDDAPNQAQSQDDEQSTKAVTANRISPLDERAVETNQRQPEQRDAAADKPQVPP